MTTRTQVSVWLTMTAVLSTSAMAVAAQDPATSANQQQPIVIPPAVVGMAAASEDLRSALDESTLPKTVPGLLAELTKRANDIQQTIASGEFGQVWVPAMGTKTVALVLETHSDGLSEQSIALATTAIKQIVTAAWELDTFGDLGNRAQIEAAYARLAAGVTDLKTAHGSR